MVSQDHPWNLNRDLFVPSGFPCCSGLVLDSCSESGCPMVRFGAQMRRPHRSQDLGHLLPAGHCCAQLPGLRTFQKEVLGYPSSLQEATTYDRHSLEGPGIYSTSARGLSYRFLGQRICFQSSFTATSSRIHHLKARRLVQYPSSTISDEMTTQSAIASPVDPHFSLNCRSVHALSL